MTKEGSAAALAVLAILVVYLGAQLIRPALPTSAAMATADLASNDAATPSQPPPVARPASGPTTSEPTAQEDCQPFSMTVQRCAVGRTVELYQAAGLPAGLFYCMRPGPNGTLPSGQPTWRRIRAILANGERVDVNAGSTLQNISGYEFSPNGEVVEITYWFAKEKSCPTP